MLWVTSQDFAKWKTLLRYISVVSFISIATVVVKLKNLKVFLLIQHPWKYCSILLKFWPGVVSNETKAVLEKSFKILNFSLNGRHAKFTVLFHFGVQFTAGKPKILLITKISAKTKSLGIPNSVSSTFQRNHRILVKLNKKTKHFFGPKLGLNCSLSVQFKKTWKTPDLWRTGFSLLKVTLPYVCFSRYFSFVIDNAKSTSLFFKFCELFQIAQSIIC